MAKREVQAPVMETELGFAFCPYCYPMLALVPEQLHDGHYRWGFPNSRVDILEDGVPLTDAEEAYELPGVPGLVLRELIRDPEKPSRIITCGRNGHFTPLVRLRYSPTAEIRRTQHGDSS